VDRGYFKLRIFKLEKPKLTPFSSFFMLDFCKRPFSKLFKHTDHSHYIFIKTSMSISIEAADLLFYVNIKGFLFSKIISRKRRKNKQEY